MTAEQIIDYCLKYELSYVDYPFGLSPVCIKIKTERHTPIFAQVYKDKITLKCNPEQGLFFRNLYPNTITRGYYCPPVQQPYWNTIRLDGTISDKELKMMIYNSYCEVVKKLPKYIQKKYFSIKLSPQHSWGFFSMRA
jgi:predicted DNA-binding protein (MmcQ/YjbR family)